MAPSGSSRDRRRSTGGLRRASELGQHTHRRRTFSVAGGGSRNRATRWRRPPWDVSKAFQHKMYSNRI